MHSTPRPAGAGLSLLPVARLALYAGLFMVSLLVFRVGGGVTVGDGFLVAAVGFTIADSVINGRRVPARGVVAFALVFLGGILASLASADPSSSAAVLARVVLLAFLVPWCMGVLLSTPRRVRRAVAWFAGGAALCGLGAVAQVAGYTIPGSEVTSGGRFPGFAVHVSDTGGITCLAVVYGAGIMLSKGRVQKAFGFAVLVAGLGGLILSGSVSGMISAIAGGIALLVWHRLSPLKTVCIAVAVIGAGAWAVSLMSTTANALTPTQRLLQVTGVTADSAGANTSESRWASIVAGWDGFVESAFFGVGLEPAASLTANGLPAHNFLVASLFQGGILFTIGVCVVIYTTTRAVLRKCWAGGLHTATAVGVVTALIFAMTAPSVYNRYFWIPLALSLAASRIPTTQPSRRGRASQAGPRVVTVPAEPRNFSAPPSV